MVIEALINGEVLTREEVPSELLLDVEGATTRQNIEFREQIVNMYLEAFRKKMDRFFKQSLQVDYRLVFSSKLNTYAQEVEEL
jgi:hypothetical protein